MNPTTPPRRTSGADPVSVVTGVFAVAAAVAFATGLIDDGRDVARVLFPALLLSGGVAALLDGLRR